MYDELVKALRERADALYNASRLYDSDAEDAAILYKAADAIEDLSKRINGVAAERDAAMKRLWKWCGVCPVDRCKVEDCEIAMIGPEYISPDWAACQPEPPHGRLIDEQWLKNAMITTLESLKKNPQMDMQEMHLIAAFNTLRAMVEDAPTIIPANEG